MKSKAEIRRIREYYERLRPPENMATWPDGTFRPAEKRQIYSQIFINKSQEPSWYDDPTYFMKGPPDAETLRVVEARRATGGTPQRSRPEYQATNSSGLRSSLLTTADPSTYSVYEALPLPGRRNPSRRDGTPLGQFNLPGYEEARGRLTTLIKRQDQRKRRY